LGRPLCPLSRAISSLSAAFSSRSLAISASSSATSRRSSSGKAVATSTFLGSSMHHFASHPSRHAKPKNAIAARNSAPLTKQAAKPLYETDFYVWAREHAALLRAGRYEELDLQNLIEEVDDLGISLYQSVRSRVRTIIEHLLKLEHSHAREPRDLWRDTIAVQRADLEDDLTASLRARIEAELPKQ
jgi:hypothetical protein